jgi:hypothetical protein
MLKVLFTILQAAYREEPMQAQLDEIWYLQMNIGRFTDELVPAVVSLLRGTPNLCTLYMRYKPTSHDSNSNVSSRISSIFFMLLR